MRITHPLWPAVREAARMLLRDEGLVVHLPVNTVGDLQELSLTMADHQPGRIDFPLPRESDNGDFFIQHDMDHQSVLKVTSGSTEPGMETVWLPVEAHTAWKSVLKASQDLIRAGYPGCIGCGGSGSEFPWDEPAHRQRIANHSEQGNHPM